MNMDGSTIFGIIWTFLLITLLVGLAILDWRLKRKKGSE